MRRQQGQEERPQWSPGLVAGPHDRTREEGEESDPSSTGGFEMDYEDDRFSTDHDDRAGRRWRINSGLESDERDQRRRDVNDVDDANETERGVFYTRPASTTPQDRDRRGRFTAQEPPTWSPWDRDGRRDRMRQPSRYDDGSPLRPNNERMSRGRQAGGRSAMDRPTYGASDDDGPARAMRGRDERYLPFANDSYRGRDSRDMVRGRELRDAPFANDSYRNVSAHRGRPFDEPRFEEPRGRRFDEPRYEQPGRRFDEQRFDEPRRRRFDEPRFEAPHRRRFDERREPRFDERREPRFDERREPRFDERREPRFDERREPRFDEQRSRRFDEPRGARFEDRREPRFDERRSQRFDEQRGDPYFADHGRWSPDDADALGYGVYRRRHESRRFDDHPGERRRFDEHANRRGLDDRRRFDDLRFDQEGRHWTDERERRHDHAPPDELGFHRGSPPRYD